ncbi:DC-STAMP domain-containing protein 2-like [Physella acuta]|uniref:DC-STAMP domain-containing protein 2-like n=1 Tax=Physella acuta TaxID=109671 RepID=UPI0027DCACD8|nr:DC-STAMP domain-containing protein 2-like [Physella acuta]
MSASELVMKALRVRKILIRLGRAKENTVREMVGLPPVTSWFRQCCDGISSSIRETICRAFCPCCVEVPTFAEFCCPKGSLGFKCCNDGFYPNTIIKNFLGFCFGLLLSMAIFFFLCLQLEANMEFALVVCVILGLGLSIGLAFFRGVRCIVYLALPNFCSSKGRSFLIMYAMVLVMNHPVHNFSSNMDVLSDAVTCGQSMALNETKKLVEAAASPLLSVITGIKKMLVAVKKFADDVRDAFKALLRAVEEIVAIVGRVFEWLRNMVNVCNDNLGQPYRKCKKAFDDGYRDCCNAMSIFDFVCGIVTLVSYVCYIAKITELLCLIVGIIKDFIVSKVARPLVSKMYNVRDMFYFNVTLDYHFTYNMNQSRPYSEIREAILREIREKLSVFDIIQAIIDNVMAFTILLVVVKAVMYRRGYLYKDHYDNVYVTNHLLDIDAKRKEMKKDTIMPLKVMETFKYIPTFSYMMTKSEIKKLIKGVMFWLFAAFHATYYIICDYGLYWILSLIRRHMDVRTSAAVPPHLQLHVQGQGPMADMYKAMVGVIEPVADSGLDIDTSPCLPHAKEPNFTAYKTIAGIMCICFFLTLFEAYGLRLRHVVAACYYPVREKARAVWLYNHIMLRRDGFLVTMRRQLQRKWKNEKGIEKLSILSSLEANFPCCKIVTKLMGRKRKRCLCCGKEGKAKDTENFVDCVNCKAPYCNDCFVELGNVCTACMNPVDYGDPDDLSVETDSSEDEADKAIRVASLKARKQKVLKKRQDRRPSKVLSAFQKRFGSKEGEQTDVEKQEVSSDEGETSSEYNTDYQHGSADTSEEDVKPRLKTTVKKSDKVSMDIFKRKDSR